MPILLKNNPGSGPEPGFIDKAAYSRYKRLHSQPAMQYPSNQPHSGAWLGLPPDEERPVGRGARYRCILLMLLYWALLSAVPQGADRYAEIGTVLPAWMGALELTPFLLVPAFLFLAVRTGAQWRALMIAVYAGLLLNLLMNLALIQDGYLPAVIPPVLRMDYISLLERAHRDPHDFIQFIAERELESQKEILRLFQIPFPKMEQGLSGMELM